jgi:hypothetical protein
MPRAALKDMVSSGSVKTTPKSPHPSVQRAVDVGGPLDMVKLPEPVYLSGVRLEGIMRNEFDITEITISSSSGDRIARFDFGPRANRPIASEIALALEQARDAGFEQGKAHMRAKLAELTRSA